MRSPFLVHVSAPEQGKSQTDGRHGLTAMNLDEPDELDDQDEDDDDDLDDQDDDKGDDDDDDWDEEDDEEEGDEEEPETWQVALAGRCPDE
jgi:hypothetical protein